MKYEQVERKMPLPLKEQILRQPWCEASQASQESVESFVEVLTRPHHLIKLYRELSSDERRTLRIVMSTIGCLPFTSERLEKEAAIHMSGAQVSLGLWGLRRYGVIVAFRKSWGEQLFVMPEDAFAGWQGILFPHELKTLSDQESQLDFVELGDLGERYDDIADSDDEVTQANPRGLAQQLLHFMINSSRQQALSLTNKGTLHKKQVQNLTEHVSLPKDILTMSGLTYAFKDTYDEPAALLLEMAIQMGFLSKNEAGNSLLIHHANFQTWLHGSYEHQQTQLYLIWRQAIVPAPVWLEHGISLMERGSLSQWYSLDELAKAIQSCCSIARKTREDGELKQELFTAWIKPLTMFRFIEVARDQEGHLWFKWLVPPHANEILSSWHDDSSHQSTAPSLYVQPDFEILLPPDASLLLEWQIAAFADLQRADLVRTYRLTKKSFQRALGRKLKGVDVIQLLQANAYYEVPEQVVMALTEWEAQKDKLYVEDVALLRCQSIDVAEALLRNEKCSSLLGDRIGETNFIISREHVKHLTKCLEAMGFHPNRSLPSHSAEEEGREPVHVATIGLCYSRDTIQLYEIDAHLPERADLYPDMQQIPMSWIKEFRDYHASTRKDMIRKAIEWKSVLQLRKEGRDCFIIPRMLREDRTGWILEGWEEYQEIAWPSEDWKEMKLILPGINDGAAREKEETLGEL